MAVKNEVSPTMVDVVSQFIGNAMFKGMSMISSAPTNNVRAAKQLHVSYEPASQYAMGAEKIHFETIADKRVTFYCYPSAGVVRRVVNRKSIGDIKGTLADAIEQSRLELAAVETAADVAIATSSKQSTTTYTAPAKVTTDIHHEQAIVVQEERGIVHAIGSREYGKNDDKYMSDYCEITLGNGQIVDFHGVDIMRACKASNAQLGDYVRVVKSQTKVIVSGRKPKIKNLFTIEIIKKGQ